MKPVSPPEARVATAPLNNDRPGQGTVLASGRSAYRTSWIGSVLVGTPSRRILTGCVLLALVAAGGAYFAFRPGPTPLDSLAFRIFPSWWYRHSLTYVADLGRARVIVPGVALSAFIAFFWDRRRAIACLVGPAVAIGITEYLAKPAVGRTFGGILCYPSGHMTAVVAVLSAFVMGVPPRWRRPAALLAVLVAITVGITLLLLRWHYLTDVLAGTAVSVGALLIVDAIVHFRPARPALS